MRVALGDRRGRRRGGRGGVDAEGYLAPVGARRLQFHPGLGWNCPVARLPVGSVVAGEGHLFTPCVILFTPCVMFVTRNAPFVAR